MQGMQGMGGMGGMGGGQYGQPFMMSGGGGGMSGGGFGNGQYDMFGKRKRRSANVSTLKFIPKARRVH
jgi:hypothetical protein